MDIEERVAGLPCWSGPVSPEPLEGGITNKNYVVADAGKRYVVRIGDDILVHQVMRFNELAASRAAEQAGISPAVKFHAPGVLVLDYIEGETLGAEQVREQARLERILPLIKQVHQDMPRAIRGPILMFWVFHVLRDYAWSLKEGGSVHLDKLEGLLKQADVLEQAVGPIEVVFGHNDLLPANFIDDGKRIWLIDWDYAGFNSPLFDLGGLASNNGLSEDQERWMLESYFARETSPQVWRSYQAMKCASLLRETVWSMISEIHSELDFDYAAYTAENLATFDAAYQTFQEL